MRCTIFSRTGSKTNKILRSGKVLKASRKLKLKNWNVVPEEFITSILLLLEIMQIQLNSKWRGVFASMHRRIFAIKIKI
jgi:hypothetical protein